MIRRNVAAVALLALLPAIALAETPSSLTEKSGVSILVLHGGPRDQGFQHGRALAKEIFQAAGELHALRQKSLLKSDEVYKGLLKKFSWDKDASEELDGMLEGVREIVGDALVAGTERTIERSDLEGINTLADVLPFGCSSFTVSGDQVQGGGTLTGRNLDYPPLSETILARKLVIVHKATAKKLAWATVGWPGAIGCYTGMNQDGITASIHDVRTGPEHLQRTGLTPRSMGLRAILENVKAYKGWVDRAADVLRERPVIFGNNIHVSCPRTRSNELSGAILEWDPDQSRERGVTVRLSENGEPLICTNHWRSRATPIDCPRYAALTKKLGEGEKLTPDAALSVLKVSAVSGRNVTVHSVVFALESRTIHVAFAGGKTKAAAFEPSVAIPLADYFQGSSTPKRWF